MDRRTSRISIVLLFTGLAIGLLPVIPVGEVLAPERSHVSGAGPARYSPDAFPTSVSPVADATTLEKLRHLFSH